MIFGDSIESLEVIVVLLMSINFYKWKKNEKNYLLQKSFYG
jgi:hypothetical protein